MGEGQPVGVKGLPPKMPVVGTVEEIPGQGMADMPHVYPDLVCAAGVQPDAKQGISTVWGNGHPCKMSDGRITVYGIDTPFDNGTGSAADGSVDGTLFRSQSLYHSQVFPVDVPFLHLGGEDHAAVSIFCHDE